MAGRGVGVLSSLLLWLTVASVSGADPNLPPGRNFDLSHWKLTLPDTNATEVEAAELATGFTNAFFSSGLDGAMTFWCPVTGGVTDSTLYPRCELREMLDPDHENVNWTWAGTNVLNAQCKVTRIPSSKRVIISQIHGYAGSAPPLAKLQLNNGLVEALVKLSPDKDGDLQLGFANVTLGDLITYQLSLTNGLLCMTVNGSNRFVDVVASAPAWTNQTFYFKAGSYCQDNSGPNTEGATVAFYQLRVFHNGPSDATPVITIVGSALDSRGHFSFTLVGPGGGSYFVEASTNLIIWSYLLITNSVSGRVSFAEPVTPGPRFYRGGLF